MTKKFVVATTYMDTIETLYVDTSSGTIWPGYSQAMTDTGDYYTNEALKQKKDRCKWCGSLQIEPRSNCEKCGGPQ
jgi:hypothetical protein